MPDAETKKEEPRRSGALIAGVRPLLKSGNAPGNLLALHSGLVLVDLGPFILSFGVCFGSVGIFVEAAMP